jgi:hypothetical protein
MADKPKTDDEKTPATDEKDQIIRPNGMNPHAVPETAPADEQADEDA